jgi:hypothetical protein
MIGQRPERWDRDTEESASRSQVRVLIAHNLRVIRARLRDHGWVAPMDRVDRLEDPRSGYAIESGYVFGEVWVKLYRPGEKAHAWEETTRVWDFENEAYGTNAIFMRIMDEVVGAGRDGPN